MRWPDLPPLNTLLPFEATVRHMSVTRAAQELHLTHGAVSRQILNLERALGTPLFERRARSMRPTAAGQQLAAAPATPAVWCGCAGEGQLVAPFGFVPDGTGYFLLSVRPPDQDDRIGVLLDWLRGQAALLGDRSRRGPDRV